MNRLPVPSLHLITSRTRLAPDARTDRDALLILARQLDEAMDAGIDVIHIRERDLDAGVLLPFVSQVSARASGTATAVLVSDRADIARVAGAAGVHLPSTGMPADRVRALAPAWVVGRSIHCGDLPADRDACDYLLFGTVFTSASKAPGSPVAGLAALGDAVARTGRPVIAIGGIDANRARPCVDAGASGIAAIGVFLPPGRTPDAMGPRAAIAALRAATGRR